MATPTRQQPAVNRDNAFFFESLAQGRLTIQQCTRCHAHRHPPVPMCPRCHSLSWQADEVSGMGTLVTFTALYHPVLPPFVPGYLVGLVELQDGVRLVVNLECAEDEAQIGMPVEVVPQRYGDDLVLPAGYLPGAPHVVVSSTEALAAEGSLS
ncbi:MAG: OB-fold domain-containing protein [Intrasporangium sp.]|uniref:Zn-ribbon domain-containing OB-fold protein n=1 Tax=Intrasporangium sp. TaxID=1925024 RepID=UPI002647314F|nr:OB-fold domain-containing protein [Intrasporangium sp.]MDN5796921.1 OB-fold domain-containing protein [Intrasporangium sp.]